MTVSRFKHLVIPSSFQNPPSFTLSDPKPALARSTSFEGPPRESLPTEDLKRQSLMEPLNVPMTTEPLVQATPQVLQQPFGLSSVQLNIEFNHKLKHFN